LTLINDSERYGGSAQTFKALTGGDSLRYEEKLKSIGEPFVYTGMVMLVANEPIQTSDPSSGLARRRLTVEFNRPLYEKGSEARDMIKIENGNVSGCWKRHLPGLVNWVLAMSNHDMRRYLIDTHELVPSLRRVKNNILISSNNLIEWLNAECVFAEGHVSAVGKKVPAPRDQNSGPSERYCSSNSHLYPSYCAFAEDTGSKPVGQKRFINLLIDNCTNQLGLEGVITFSKYGRPYVKNIAVRNSDQKFREYPTILTEGKETE
jgi:putative DNA primase/helicase